VGALHVGMLAHPATRRPPRLKAPPRPSSA